MTYQPKKQIPERPDDNLPPDKLQEEWDRYLDFHVGKQGKRPRKELLISPILFEWIEKTFVGDRRLTPLKDSPRKLLYLEVLRDSLKQIPLVNRSVLRRYFGMKWDTPQTQEEIGKALGLSQKTISLRLRNGKRDLKRIMQQKMVERVKQEMQND